MDDAPTQEPPVAERRTLVQVFAGRTEALPTTDVLHVVLPLMRQVAALHAATRVAALTARDVVEVADGSLALAQPDGMAPVRDLHAIDKVQPQAGSALKIVGEYRVTHDGADGSSVVDLDTAGDEGEPITKPVYLPDLRRWEIEVGHHDEITDVFGLGLILAGLACGFDPTERDDIVRFSMHRANLFALQPRLHPVLAAVIVEATALNRHDRATDVSELIARLEAHRDQPVALDVDRVLAGASGIPGRRQAVLSHLRDRLFDLSRRNRLIHFKPTQASVNLTEASVPIVVRLESIRAEQLCTWGGTFAEGVLSGKAVALNRWLRFEDQPHLSSTFDRLIADTRRDRAEYGFSNLRLVVAFLRWHNIKDAPEERIVSPLLWLPVEVTRAKGVRDQYVLRAPETCAEFNPALRHMLRQLYDIQLPETVDLKTSDPSAVHADLLRQIRATEPGVTLELQARPAIQLIFQRAVQRVRQFNRRRGTGKTAVTATADYSYARDDYRPLGHALFEKFVKPSPLPQRLAAGGYLEPSPQYMVAATEGKSFALGVDEGHRFAWEVDLTQVTLANFNYKKMSLVRDYSELLETATEQPAFDRVFSIEPRALDRAVPPPIAGADAWNVVAADATQEAAVTLARTGDNFIIQGPPGTGKSQTITNLIADYAARGKRVLFVCEKRAALDVVFHRLGQAGLDGLSCIIHDSQEDKKAWIADLKSRYESWSKTGDGLAEAEAARDGIVSALATLGASLDAFDAAVGASNGSVGLRALVRRAAALPTPSGGGAAMREQLPDVTLWDAHRTIADRAARAASEVLGVPTIAEHPFASINAELVRSDRPYAAVEEALGEAEAHVERVESWIDAGSLCADAGTPLGVAAAATRMAETMRRTGLAAMPALLDPASPLSADLASDAAGIGEAAAALARAEANSGHWSDPLTPSDTAAALALAREKERSFFKFLSGGWRTLKSTLAVRYDFAAHAVRPSVTSVLEGLQSVHEARNALDTRRAAASARYGVSDIDGLVAARSDLLDALPRLPAVRRMVEVAQSSPDASAALAREAAMAGTLEALSACLSGAFDGTEALTIDRIGERLRDLRESLDDLPTVLSMLAAVHDADPAISNLLRHVPLRPDALDALIVDEALARIERASPDVRRFDIDRLIATTREAGALRDALRDRNAAVIRARVHAAFRENLRRSTLSVSQLDPEGRRFKTTYATGRRELEHEFGKTMRHRSIRDLSDDETGVVVRDLKPIWLMSPLSISDTLPIAEGFFDVVIFDEASQIPIEEAVPALCRSPQVIIVGDEMQLPPTSFFSSRPSEEDMEIVAEEDGARVSILLDADSLLAQSARNLPATMLAWHYRSRSEALIGFSNAAFYNGQLVTIPDRSLRAAAGAPEPVRSDDEDGWAAGATQLLAAPITVHRMADGVYDKRVNPPEARYIAGLVRELLSQGSGQSIGIVAFSEAQQSEIEGALDRLAATDTDFAGALERETAREDDGQYNGLFVKNLENVQGDERDIMVMSICYAPGRDGKMAMNFGPINTRGGEKRLNVIFSRARRHMAIVTTIAPEAITNVHNDGARALRAFLSFAGAQSAGATDRAQAVLSTLGPDAGRTFGTAAPPDPVRSAIAEALRARGHVVHEHVGGASFRCDLAIVAADGETYALGILLDHDGGPGAGERYLFRPSILRAFGWRILDVPVATWLRARTQVVDRIEAELARDSWAMHEIEAPRPVPVVADPVQEPDDILPTDTMTEFRLKQGPSDKFWRVGVIEADLIVEFGRTGTKGQRVVKTFEDGARARREAVKLTLEKTKKGYEEIG